MRHRLIIPLISILLIGVGAADAPRSEKVSISKDFLPKLRATPDAEAWENHMHELIYLVSIDDIDAKGVARAILPKLWKIEIVYPERDYLAYQLYDVCELEGMDSLPVEDQVATIKYYDRKPGLDWNSVRRAFLKNRPTVRKLVGDLPDRSR